MGRDVGDDERLAAREHLLDLGVLREIDRQVAQLLVVAGGDDVADVARLAHEDDAHAIDLGDLGDALHDGEEDAAEVEVRRQGLRELEHEPRVLLLLRQRLDEAAQAKLPAYARDELDGLEGLADEVVGAGLEGLARSPRRPRGPSARRPAGRASRRGRAGCAGSGSRRAAASRGRAARATAAPSRSARGPRSPSATAMWGRSALASAWIRTCRLTVSSSTTRTGPPGTAKKCTLRAHLLDIAALSRTRSRCGVPVRSPGGAPGAGGFLPSAS